MRSPTTEFERTLKDGTIVSVRAYGRFVPCEPNFPSDIIGFDVRVFRACGECGPGCDKMCEAPKELFEKDIPIEWERLENAAMDAICEPCDVAEEVA